MGPQPAPGAADWAHVRQRPRPYAVQLDDDEPDRPVLLRRDGGWTVDRRRALWLGAEEARAAVAWVRLWWPRARVAWLPSPWAKPVPDTAVPIPEDELD